MVYRLALVTGATSGIGQALCKLFAQKGIDLIASGRDQQQLQALKGELSTVNIQVVQADLAQPQDRQRLIDVIHKRVPDLVINNAGFGLYGEVLTYSTEEQAAILEVNGRAVLELTLEAARTLVSNDKKGVILNVSSAAGFYVFPYSAIYASSKAFVNYFSQAIDFEVKPHGIRVLTLCPGMVATAFQKRAGQVTNQEHLGVMTAPFVAEQIWKQIEQLRPLLIINGYYRLLIWFSSLFPLRWVASIMQRLIAKRIVPRPLIKIKK